MKNYGGRVGNDGKQSIRFRDITQLDSQIIIEMRRAHAAYAPNVVRSAMAPDTIVVDVAANAQ